MTDQELEQRLRTALEHAAPDHLEALLSRCEPRRGNVIPMTVPARKPRKKAAMAWLAAACLALVVVGGGAGVQYYQANAVASVISLDVNPSVELDVNRQEKVVSAVPLNADANEILDGMDLKGADLNVAVNAIMGSLLKHGYVDELANSILISVEDDDAARGAALEQKLTRLRQSQRSDPLPDPQWGQRPSAKGGRVWHLAGQGHADPVPGGQQQPSHV